MTTITIPAQPVIVPELTASSSSSITSYLTTAANAVSDVSDWVDTGSAGEDAWTGDAAARAAHAMTRVAGEVDLAQAALVRGGAALERYLTAVSDAETDRAELVKSRVDLCAAIEDLEADVRTGTEDDALWLIVRSSTLTASVMAFDASVQRWLDDFTEAEDILVQELSAIDTPGEVAAALGADSTSVDDALEHAITSGLLPPEVRGMSADELETFLLEHPEAAAALRENWPNVGGGPVTELAGIAAMDIVMSPAGRSDEESARARELFESLPAEDAKMLALLYPELVGNLSGVPFEYRADANRISIVAALADEEARLADLEQRIDDNTALGPRRTSAAHLHEGVADATARIALYRSIVDGDRQILLFDPKDDGAIAELHRPIGPGTKNVGVDIPGTGNDISNYDELAKRSRTFNDASPDDSLSMISWLGGDFPDEVLFDAVDTSYSQDLGPKLADFSRDVDQEITHATGSPDVKTAYMAHSYGGAALGIAEQNGLVADRTLYVEAAGMGTGVNSPADLPASQAEVDRYSMTAPGDMIELSQDTGHHGADPDRFEGTTELHTGSTKEGVIIEGSSSHSGVYEVGSDSWKGMFGVMTGGVVETAHTREYYYPRYGGAPTFTGYAGDGQLIDIE